MRTKNGLELKHSALLIQLMIIGLLFVLIACMLSCNNKPAETTKPGTDTNAINTSSPNRLDDETFILRLDSSDLVNIFKEGKNAGHVIKALLFEWKTGKKKYLLRVRGCSEKNSYITNPYDLAIVGTTSVGNGKNLIRNPQFITRGGLKDLFGIPTGTNTEIPDDKFKTIYFQASTDENPNNIGKKYLYLFYSTDLNNLNSLTGKGMFPVGTGYTNPSPPKPPCDGDCDTQ